VNDAAIVISSRALWRLLIAVLAIVLVVALLGFAWQERDRIDLGIFTRGAGDEIDRSTFQAVLLSGGQTYFGRLATHGDAYFVLTDVYYLPPADSPQAGQLIKRGAEVQGPQDKMVIPAQALLFFENLRADGDVMAAIRRFQSQPPPPAAPSGAAPASPRTPAPATSASPLRPSPTR